MTAQQSAYLRLRLVTWVLACIPLVIPVMVRAQCWPTGLAKTQPPQAQTAATGQPEFYDEPRFTVAGVTDASNPGGHGSDTIRRTTEALAKATISLGHSSESAENSQPVAASSVAAREQSLQQAAREPGSFDANYQLGKLLAEGGKLREALPYLERASQLSPASKAIRDQADLHHLLGDIEEKLGNPLEAVRYYQRAAELDPSEPNLFDWGAELLVHRAFEPAIEVLTRGNRLFPNSRRMLIGTGVAWYARGSYEQAAQHFCEASDLNPDDPDPYLFLGKMQNVETSASDGIVERLARFARLQPENPLANYYYAVSLWKQRTGSEDAENSAHVQSLLEKAVRLDPKLGAGYLQLGILFAERKDLSKAISAYRQAIAATPQLEEAHYRLAQIYRKTGENSKAQQELTLYEQIKKETAGEAERQRREIQEFVYTLRDRTSAVQPQ